MRFVAFTIGIMLCLSVHGQVPTQGIGQDYSWALFWAHMDSMHYPDSAKDLEGKVWIQFDVSRDGGIANEQVLLSPDPFLGWIVKEHLRKTSSWLTLLLSNSTMDMRMQIPIEFQINR